MNDPDRNTMRDTAAIVLLAVAVTFGAVGGLLLIVRPGSVSVNQPPQSTQLPPLQPAVAAQQQVDVEPIPDAVPPDAAQRPSIGDYELHGQFSGQVSAMATTPPLVENGYEVVGPTSRKPTAPHPGQRYLDTDLNTYSIYNGTSWLSVNTSAGVGVLDDVGDVSITGAASGDFLGWNGSAWADLTISLDTLSDVSVSSPAVKQTLRYNGTSWVNSQLATTDLSDTNFTSLADNQISAFDSSTAKWVNTTVAVIQHVFSVEDYGAVPDDGINDADDFQEAFDAAKAAAPATVVIPPGVWTLTDKITLTSASDITVKAEGATIQATVRISPWWFCWDNCTNIKWYGGVITGPETTATMYDRYISLEGVNRTITAIGTDDYISTTTTFGASTNYDHGLKVGDTVTITGSNSTPTVDGTRTVTAVDPKNPLGRFSVGVDVTVAGTAGTIVGYGEPAIQSCTTGNPSSPPVVTVDSTAGLVSGETYYFHNTGTVVGPTVPGPLIDLNRPTATGTRGALDGLRSITVLSGTTLTFTDTASTDIPTVTSAQTSAGGEVRHGIDASPGDGTGSTNTTRLGDYERSAVFWFLSGSGHRIEGVTSSGCESLLYNDTANKWVLKGCRHTGPFTEGFANGLRHGIFNDHKQVILPAYTIGIEGGYDFHVDDLYCAYAAGALVGGAGNPLKLSEEDQISGFARLSQIHCEYFFDNGVYVAGRNYTLTDSVFREGLSSGSAAKFRGFNHSVSNCKIENVHDGLGLEGTLNEGTLEDVWGNGGAWLSLHDNVIRNVSTSAIWTDDNNGLWPRDLRIVGNQISNAGGLSSTLTTANLPHLSIYGDRDTNGNASQRVPVKLYNVNRLEFRGNTIDDSESGGIETSKDTTDGFVAFKIAENHFTAHRLGFKSYLTVSGHSEAGYNGTHFVTELMGDPDATPGENDKTAGRWVKTATTATTASDGTGGVWTHPRNDYAVYIGNAGGGSGNGQSDVAGSIIKENTIIGGKMGFYLAGVTNCDITGNRGVELWADNTPSALFNVSSLRRSTLRDNSVYPLGARLLSVDSGGTYSGITESNNTGLIYTSLASTTATPNLTNSVLRAISDRVVDTADVKGDENVLMVTGTSQVHADTWVTTNSTGIAAWCDDLTRIRFRQDTSTKRPLYMLNTTAGGGAGNALNNYAIVRFDGSNDLLRMNGPVSLAQSGTIYVVAKCTNDASDVTLFSSTDEDTATTYFLVKRRTSDDRIQIRLRNGGSDTESVYNAAASSWPIDTWRIFRIASDGTNVTFAISDGVGVQTGPGGLSSLMVTSTPSITGADGRWFGDVDGSLWRDSLVIGGHVLTDTETSFFPGDVAEILIYDGDVSANWATIEQALFAKWGDL